MCTNSSLPPAHVHNLYPVLQNVYKPGLAGGAARKPYSPPGVCSEMLRERKISLGGNRCDVKILRGEDEWDDFTTALLGFIFAKPGLQIYLIDGAWENFTDKSQKCVSISHLPTSSPRRSS